MGLQNWFWWLFCSTLDCCCCKAAYDTTSGPYCTSSNGWGWLWKFCYHDKVVIFWSQRGVKGQLISYNGTSFWRQDIYLHCNHFYFVVESHCIFLNCVEESGVEKIKTLNSSFAVQWGVATGCNINTNVNTQKKLILLFFKVLGLG